MTKFEDKSFSVSVGDNENYRKNWEKIFGNKNKDKLVSANENLKNTPQNCSVQLKQKKSNNKKKRNKTK